MFGKKFQIMIYLSLIIFLSAGCSIGQAAHAPQSGSIFSGNLTLVNAGSNTSANGGEIEFAVSEDGESITSLSYLLVGDKCWDETKSITVSGVGAKISRNPPPSIENGGFVWADNEIKVDAVFTSSTEASGSMTLSVINRISNPFSNLHTQFVCDYGTWEWNANVK
ncbi:MAG TPA: hypothetical protein PLF42_00885 [Anaerolineales bacterium]|nr:hypothetical protein [Anaerolineales bacterium]